MSDNAILDLLMATGCLTEIHAADGDEQGGLSVGLMDPLANPTAVSTLARYLADALPDPKPEILVAWPGLANVTIAFAAGVALGRPVVLLSDAEGLVTASGDVGPGQGAALIGVTLSERDANLARAFVVSKGGNLATTASLVGFGDVDGELCLFRLDNDVSTESDSPDSTG